MSITTNWIFQGTPDIWDVSSNVGSVTRWVVRQHKPEIHRGHRAYIWESGANAGIVAVAEIDSEPTQMPDTPKELTGYVNGQPPGFQGKQLRVCLSAVNKLPTRITKKYLQTHPVLRNLAILHQPRGTNFPLSQMEADALDQVIDDS